MRVFAFEIFVAWMCLSHNQMFDGWENTFYYRGFSFLVKTFFALSAFRALWIFMSFACRTREPFYDIEFHSINLSSALLYCEEKLLSSHKIGSIGIVERCESSLQFISWLPRLDKFPRFILRVFFVVLSCFIYHIIFAGEFSFPQHSTKHRKLLLKAEQTHNTPRDEILISEGKETFGECVKIMKRIRNETIRKEKFFLWENFPG